MTKTHEAKKVGEERDIRGQVWEKFCKYTMWQVIENIVWERGKLSVK